MPRQGLDQTIVVAAALELIDRDGFDAFTMRSLARDLGVEAPSLYKHVTGRDEILDMLVEQIFNKVRIGDSDDPWQQRMRLYSHALRDAILEHPTMAPTLATRPIVSPMTLQLVENVLAELTDIGFDVNQSIFALDTIVAYVLGHVLSQLSINPAVGGDPEQVAAMRSMLPEDQFPRVRATLGNGPVDRDREFEFGLTILIHGFEAALAA